MFSSFQIMNNNLFETFIIHNVFFSDQNTLIKIDKFHNITFDV